jgi:predicted site-specific integrase-resolvase
MKAENAERRPWFTPETLANHLQVSQRMVRKWVQQGRLDWRAQAKSATKPVIARARAIGPSRLLA